MKHKLLNSRQNRFAKISQPFSAASYTPNRPVTGEEEGAAPAEAPLRDAEVSEEELNRDYQDRPRNKLDVPAFLRKQ